MPSSSQSTFFLTKRFDFDIERHTLFFVGLMDRKSDGAYLSTIYVYFTLQILYLSIRIKN